MKKLFFRFISLGVVIGTMVIMSCGGGGGVTKESLAATAVVADLMIGEIGTLPILASVGSTPVCDGIKHIIPTTTIACGFTQADTGDVSYGGTYICDGTTYKASITETFENNCTFGVITCSMGNTILVGVATVNLDLSIEQFDSGIFSFSIKSDDITLLWGNNKNADCAVNLTFNINPDIDWSSETAVEQAFTGTVCNADWAETIATVIDPAKLADVCAADNS